MFDAACDPLWDVCVGDGLSVAIHGSFGSRMKSFATGRYHGNVFYDHMIAHPFGQMAVVMDMIAGGVLDRYPRLRVGFFESGLGWIPYWLDRLDEHFEVMGHHTPWLKRLPSEIFRSQCFVSMEADEATGLQVDHREGPAAVHSVGFRLSAFRLDVSGRLHAGATDVRGRRRGRGATRRRRQSAPLHGVGLTAVV